MRLILGGQGLVVRLVLRLFGGWDLVMQLELGLFGGRDLVVQCTMRSQMMVLASCGRGMGVRSTGGGVVFIHLRK